MNSRVELSNEAGISDRASGLPTRSSVTRNFESLLQQIPAERKAQRVHDREEIRRYRV
jgi:hypothetical protein